jgi:hypothetical protein
MARPKPKIIWTENTTAGFKQQEMLETPTIWVIMYGTSAVRWSIMHDCSLELPTKYYPTLYHNRAHAERRLKQIQQLTKMDGFWLKQIDFDQTK